MSAVISARGLTKRYKGTVAVDSIDFDIPAWRIVGLAHQHHYAIIMGMAVFMALQRFQQFLVVAPVGLRLPGVAC